MEGEEIKFRMSTNRKTAGITIHIDSRKYLKDMGGETKVYVENCLKITKKNNCYHISVK